MMLILGKSGASFSLNIKNGATLKLLIKSRSITYDSQSTQKWIKRNKNKGECRNKEKIKPNKIIKLF